MIANRLGSFSCGLGSILGLLLIGLLPGLTWAATRCNDREVVSVDHGGGTSNGSGYAEAIAVSRDGRIVAFSSMATDLVQSPESGQLVPGAFNLFVRDRAAGVTRLVIQSIGPEAPDAAVTPEMMDMDDAGEKIVFASRASNLVPRDGNGNLDDVFLYERRTGRITLLSRSLEDPADSANDRSGAAASISVSPKGGWAVFASKATNLTGDLVSGWHLYRVALTDDPRPELVTRPWDPNKSAISGIGPAVINDQGTVIFTSASADLVPGVVPSYRRFFKAGRSGPVEALDHLAEFYVPGRFDLAGGWLAFETSQYNVAFTKRVVVARVGPAVEPGDVVSSVISTDQTARGPRLSQNGFLTYTVDVDGEVALYRQDLCHVLGNCAVAPSREYIAPGDDVAAISANGRTMVFRWDGKLGIPVPGHQYDIVAVDLDPGSVCEFRILDPNFSAYDEPFYPAITAGTASKIESVETISNLFLPEPDQAATDGETRLVLFWEAPGAGTVSFSLKDEAGLTTSTAGTLGLLDEAQPTGTITTVNVGGGPGESLFATALYWVPRGFVVEPTDPMARSRPVYIHMEYFPFGGGAEIHQLRRLELVRPPLFLLHGIWSSGQTWQWPLTRDGRFLSRPPISYPNDVTYAENVPVVSQQIQSDLEAFRRQGLAVTQITAIGHSMGGQLLRRHASSYPRNGLNRLSYRRKDNFFAGDIDRLITVDSPHLGSPLADALVNLMVQGDPRSSAWIINVMCGLDHCPHKGAVDDLAQASRETRQAPATEVPVHLMVGTGGDRWLENQALRSGKLYLILRILEFTGTSVQEVFGGDHDLVVGEVSQRAGVGPQEPGVSHYPFVSAEATGIHTDNTSEVRYSEAVQDLLVNLGEDEVGFSPLLGQDLGSSGVTIFERIFKRIRSWSALEARVAAEVEAPEISIASPQQGDTYQPGDSFSVMIEEVEAGFQISRLMILCGLQSFEITVPPYSANCEIPDSHVGPLKINAIAYSSESQLGLANEVSILVETGRPLASIRPLQAVHRLVPGDTLEIRLIATQDDGLSREVSSFDPRVELRVGDTEVVDASGGLITALGVGTTYVELGLEGQYTSVTIEVVRQENIAPEINLIAPADGTIFLEGSEIVFTATATDPEDGDLSGNIIWRSSLDGQLGAGGELSLRSLSIGSHVVSAEVLDSHGEIDSTEISMQVVFNQPPVVAILSPSSGQTFLDTASISFVATAHDPEAGDISASVVWQSDRDGLLGTGGSIDGGLSPGVHNVSASVEDPQGKAGSSSIALQVTCTTEDNLVVANRSVIGSEVYRACNSITAGPSLVVESMGALTLCAGMRVVLTSGVRVERGGELTVGYRCPVSSPPGP